jgi:hypothetical protein
MTHWRRGGPTNSTNCAVVTIHALSAVWYTNKNIIFQHHLTVSLVHCVIASLIGLMGRALDVYIHDCVHTCFIFISFVKCIHHVSYYAVSCACHAK